MNAHSTPLTRLIDIGTDFWWHSDQRWAARKLLAYVIVLLGLGTGATVVLSYLRAGLINRLSTYDTGGFYTLFVVTVLAIAVSVIINVFFEYFRTMLAITWRKWYSANLICKYMTYRRVTEGGRIHNIGVRMTDNVDSLCNSTIGLFIEVIRALANVVSFTLVLYTISPSLTVFLGLYATFGSILTAWLGRKLIGLNDQHMTREGDMREALDDVNKDHDTIGEDTVAEVKRRILVRLAKAIKNITDMMVFNRNLSFFITGFNSLATVLPFVLVAPVFFEQHMPLGVITQSAEAFAAIFAGATIIVSQFNGISYLFSCANRVYELEIELASPQKPAPAPAEHVVAKAS